MVDGNSLVHRAFHALPMMLSTSSGEPVNAVYGFTSMLLKVLEELKPNYLIVLFDVPGPNPRYQLLLSYKSKRTGETKPEMDPQMLRVKEVLNAFGISHYEAPGYEADDLIGTLAKRAEKENLETTIVSGDLDLMQLVSPKVRLLTPKKGISEIVIYDEAGVEERYGLKPDQLVDFRALKGDPSDEIPGVAGIGEKGASELIKKYGTLENLYRHLGEQSEKLKEILERGAESAAISKQLSTLFYDAPVRLDLKEAQVKSLDKEKILPLFRELGFRSLVQRLFKEDIQQLSLEEGQVEVASIDKEKTLLGEYRLLKEAKEIEEVVEQLGQVSELAVDTETSSLKPMEAKLIGLSFSSLEGKAYYLPYAKKTFGKIKAVLEGKIAKIGHNLKFDALVLSQHGINLEGIGFDTLLASYLLNPGATGLNLKNQAYAQLGVMMTDISDLIGKGKNQISMEQVPEQTLSDYASADADMALRLKKVLAKKLNESGLEHVFYDIEMPLVKVLKEMEEMGVLVDEKYLKKMSVELGKQINKLEQEIYSAVGHEFNLNSPKQMSEVLFSELKLPVVSKTKTGFSTDEATLTALKGSHPAIDNLLSYRELFKVKSTYVDALPALINPKTGRIHTSFNQTATATGRLSSSDPNLQNIPARGELGAKVRASFIAPQGKVLLSADYSQIELRIMAHLSQDSNLLKAFEEEEDIHSIVASNVFGVEEENVTDDMRRFAKVVNFGLMYGMGAHSLAGQLGVKRGEAEEFINKYFEKYSLVKDYLQNLLAEAREKGYVETISGRKRYVPELLSSMYGVRSAGERMSVNFPFQGSAADLIKAAMVKIEKLLPKRMIIQVHDELLFEIEEDKLKEESKIIEKEMEEALKLSVPIKVELKSGQNWGEMRKAS